MRVCKICGSEIELWIDKDGYYWHPFFAGYCPECDTSKTQTEIMEREQ